MNQHLSSRQISEWVLRERCPEAKQHVHGCPVCRAEVTHLEETLKQFGCSVRQWSDGQLDTKLEGVREPFWMSVRNLSWAGVAVMLVTVATLSLTWRSDSPEVTDAAVLEQVDKHVSRAVPGPMEPLQMLVRWELEE